MPREEVPGMVVNLESIEEDVLARYPVAMKAATDTETELEPYVPQ